MSLASLSLSAIANNTCRRSSRLISKSRSRHTTFQHECCYRSRGAAAKIDNSDTFGNQDGRLLTCFQVCITTPPSAPAQPQFAAIPPGRKPTRGAFTATEWMTSSQRIVSIGKLNWNGTAMESSVLGCLVLRFLAFRLHFPDDSDPSGTVFGYCHRLVIASNWDQSSRSAANMEGCVGHGRSEISEVYAHCG